MSESGKQFPTLDRIHTRELPAKGGGTQEGLYDFFVDIVNKTPDQLKALEAKLSEPIKTEFPRLLNECPQIQEKVQNLIKVFSEKHPELFKKHVAPLIGGDQDEDELPTLEPPRGGLR